MNQQINWQVHLRNFFLLLAIIIGLVILAAIITQFPWPEWTGFGSHAFTRTTTETIPSSLSPGASVATTTETQPSKTLWDFLSVIIVPATLAVIAYRFNQAEKTREREAALEQQREEALQNYLDHMTVLLLEQKLRTSPRDSEVREVARARTLTTLRMLDANRKGQLIHFLLKAQLITRRFHLSPQPSDPFSILSLQGADLTDASLQGVDLSHADLVGADLHGADLRQAYLKDVEIDKQHEKGYYTSQAKLDDKWRLVWEIVNRRIYKLDLRKRDLRDADLSGARLWGVDLSGTDLTGANLRGADLDHSKLDKHTKMDPKWQLVWQIHNEAKKERNLRSVDLSEAYLATAYLNGANLEGANLNNTDLTLAILKQANLVSAQLWQADLTEADLREADLSKADLPFSVLTETHLQKAVLQKVSLFAANLHKAELNEAHLNDADLAVSDLSGANLTGADLSGANLSGANLCEANLTGAILTKANLLETVYDATTQWPDNFDPEAVGAKRADNNAKKDVAIQNESGKRHQVRVGRSSNSRQQYI